jgi:hypothetical protein
MSIGVAVRTRMSAARNNGIVVRQERSPQSPTAYSSVRYRQTQKTHVPDRNIWTFE